MLVKVAMKNAANLMSRIMRKGLQQNDLCMSICWMHTLACECHFGVFLQGCFESYEPATMAESVHDSLDGMYDEMQGMEAVWTPPKRKRDQDPESAKKGPNPKSKAAAAKAKRKAKAKVVKRTVVKKCRGCAKKMQPGEQAANWPGCVPCKRALDNICKQAFRQGEKAQKYVAKARADDSKLQAMLASYKDLCSKNA